MSATEFFSKMADLSTRLPKHTQADFVSKTAICSICPARKGLLCGALPDTGMTNLISQMVINQKPCPRGKHIVQPVTTAEPVDFKPRVVIVTPGLSMGGAELWILSLCKWLPYDITVIMTNESDFKPKMVGLMQKYAHVLFTNTVNRDQIHKAKLEADVIIIWGMGEIPIHVGNYAAPKIWVAHGCCEWTKKFAISAAPDCQVLAGVSSATRCVFEEIDSHRMLTVHNGAEVERCTPIYGREATREAWGVSKNKFVAGYIGRLSPEKRPCAVVEGIAELDDSYQAILVGEGWKKAETMEEAAKINTSRTKFVGYMANVGDALAAMDVWVNASPSEGFCLSMIEAWLAGVPVISTPTGCLPEVEEKYGSMTYVIPFGCDGKEIAKAIKGVRENYSMALAKAERVRKIAWNYYTAAAMANRWEKVIQETIRQWPMR